MAVGAYQTISFLEKLSAIADACHELLVTLLFDAQIS